MLSSLFALVFQCLNGTQWASFFSLPSPSLFSFFPIYLSTLTLSTFCNLADEKVKFDPTTFRDELVSKLNEAESLEAVSLSFLIAAMEFPWRWDLNLSVEVHSFLVVAMDIKVLPVWQMPSEDHYFTSHPPFTSNCPLNWPAFNLTSLVFASYLSPNVL